MLLHYTLTGTVGTVPAIPIGLFFLKIKTYRNAGSDASWADVAVLVKEIFLRILILHTNAQKFNIVTMSLNIFSK